IARTKISPIPTADLSLAFGSVHERAICNGVVRHLRDMPLGFEIAIYWNVRLPCWSAPESKPFRRTLCSAAISFAPVRGTGGRGPRRWADQRGGRLPNTRRHAHCGEHRHKFGHDWRETSIYE